MELPQLIISFIVMLLVMIGITILIIRSFFFSSTESAKNRLDKDLQKSHEKQIELSRKLKEADEELEERRKEANELVSSMQSEIESTAKEEKEKIIREARAEGESIIEKAQAATEKMKVELEKEMDLRAVDFSMNILNKILSDKAKGSLNEVLVEEYLADLKDTDMSNIGPDITEAEVISLSALDDQTQTSLSSIIKEKINRELKLNFSTDPDIGGGMVIKFGSLALDGSIKNRIREEGISYKTELEARVV